ncbi:uncharacterized protein LOC132704901 [Cylas formicarius]|uniref:uncharacterized protein LOC132704901 n=1 Tax=Cylas formicarius TaxID=197179 RepID=UPI002958B431|nr:uncharacterized protein LOC132704901 [Cylas formicarius]
MLYALLYLALASTAKAYYSTNPYERHLRSDAESRVGYATSIVHDGDQKAESSINVDFGSFEAQKTNARQYKGKVSFNPSGAQFYNVGYSVSFNGKRQVQRNPVPKRQTLEHAEIITGRAKKNEQVTAPHTENIFSHALAAQKHLISGIKPKVFPGRPLEKPGRGLLEEASSFSSKTQHHIKGLEKTKALQLANRKYKNAQGSDYSRWKHLGAGVEIVKSAEIPVSTKYVNPPQDVTKFNHVGALESSQQFDATNVLGNTDSDMFGNDRQRSSYVGHNPTKLPMDMSLLRDPVIITNPQNIPNDPNVIPIHFDLRSLHLATPTEANYNPVEQNYAYREGNEPSLDDNSQIYAAEDAYDDHETSQSEVQYKVYGKPQPQPLDSFRYTNTPTNVKKPKKSNKPREPRIGNHFNKYGTIRLPPLGQKFF